MSDVHEREILTPKERQERQRQEMIDTILDVAQALMREDGVGALNLQTLAKRVGMRAPSLYNYFPNKMAIYEAVFARGMRRFREGLAAILDEHGASPAGQAATISYYMEFALEQPELFQLLFERPIPGFVPSDEGLTEGRRLLEISDAAVQQQADAGGIAADIQPEHARDLLIAMMHGLTALHLANEPERPVGEGRFGSLIPLAVRALTLVYQHGLGEDD